MAAKGGGGSWKVAYADFVTAMMAFFLVMWICGQDQKIRRSVSDYFSDPLGSTQPGASKKPTRTGSTYENITSGSVPLEEKVARGQGRRSYSKKGYSSPATKLVSDWLHHDKEASTYWQKQAHDQRESARWSKNVKENVETIEKVAVRKLTSQLQEELKREMPLEVDGIYRDLLNELFLDINWAEIAEDLIDQGIEYPSSNTAK
jgi:chemotaxis protein MotB